MILIMKSEQKLNPMLKTLKRSKIYTKQAGMMLKDMLIYRAEFFSRYIATIIRFSIAAYLWLAIINTDQGSIAGYDMKGILTYFLVIQVVTGFVFSAAMSGFRIAEMIQSGDLSTKIIQPVDYIKLTFSMDFGRGAFFFASNVVMISIIALIFKDYFILDFKPFFVFLGLFSVLIAFILNFCFVLMIGMSAFWITSSHRLIFHFFAILQLLSGMLIPIEFFPQTFQNILIYTPFPYVAYFPVTVIQSQSWTPELIHMGSISLVYTLIMIFLTYSLYNFGLKKYEAVGR
jgi:ABC-2 type transport system permease protein